MQLEQLLLGGAKALHKLGCVRLDVFDNLIFLEDDAFQGLDCALFLGCLGSENGHFLLGCLQLPLQGGDFFILLPNTFPGLLIYLFERLLDLSLLVQPLLSFGFTTVFVLLD